MANLESPAADGYFSASTSSTASQNVVQRDRAGSKEDQGKSQRGCDQGELESVLTCESIVQMHFPDCDAEIDENGEGRGSSEKSCQQANAAQEFRKRRNVAGPGWQAEACDKFGMMMQATKNLMVAVHDHNGTEGKAHEQKRKWLQAFEVAQGSSEGNDPIRAEKTGGVKRTQQNDCVTVEVLVTFFRPPSESRLWRESVLRSRAGEAKDSRPGAGMIGKFARPVPPLPVDDLSFEAMFEAMFEGMVRR